MPSSRPVNPSLSEVVALIDTRSSGNPRASPILLRISGTKDDNFGRSATTVASTFDTV